MELLKENIAKSAVEIIDTIIDGVTRFSRDAPQTDDMTLMIIKRTG
jgi:serine phosphatase RsbU (regulator of sigma subunit)